MDFIKVSVDNSCKVISYHFSSNRARTLLTHIIFYYTDSCHWESGIYPLFHRNMPLFLVKFDDSLDLPFPPFLFACSSHVKCYFYFLTLYRGNHIFGKSTYFLNQNRSDFLRCTPSENYASFGANLISIGWSHLL